ncbi:MAG: nucleotidyltransferase family protein [Bacteroidota bacterium]
MENPQKLEEIIRSAKPTLQRDYGIEKIGYFGSFARGDFDADSDIDILVSFSRKVGWKFFDLKDYLESILGRTVDLVTERSIKKRWKESILKQVRYI